MAAQEEEDQGVVVLRRLIVAGRGREGYVRRRLCRNPVLSASPRLLAAQLIRHPAVRHRDQPAPGALRDALLGPRDGGGEKRFLYGVLACVELAVAANEHAEDPRRQPTQQVLDVNVRSHISTPPAPMSGRTSTAQ